jgi:hypothetical protein
MFCSQRICLIKIGRDLGTGTVQRGVAAAQKIAAGVIAAWTSSVINSNLRPNRYVNLLTTTGDRADMLGPASSHPKLGDEMS